MEDGDLRESVVILFYLHRKIYLCILFSDVQFLFSYALDLDVLLAVCPYSSVSLSPCLSLMFFLLRFVLLVGIFCRVAVFIPRFGLHRSVRRHQFLLSLWIPRHGIVFAVLFYLGAGRVATGIYDLARSCA
jgi:hypothetical protein